MCCSIAFFPGSALSRLCSGRLLRAALTTLLAGLGCAAALAQSVPELRLTEFFRPVKSAVGLAMTDKLLAANGQTVRLVGYMVQQERAQPGRFILSPRPVVMSEHADGQADDLPPSAVTVYLDKSQQDWVVPHTRGLIALTGELHVARLEETDGRVSWVRLQLPSQAARSMDGAEIARYLETLEHKH